MDKKYARSEWGKQKLDPCRLPEVGRGSRRGWSSRVVMRAVEGVSCCRAGLHRVAWWQHSDAAIRGQTGGLFVVERVELPFEFRVPCRYRRSIQRRMRSIRRRLPKLEPADPMKDLRSLRETLTFQGIFGWLNVAKDGGLSEYQRCLESKRADMRAVELSGDACDFSLPFGFGFAVLASDFG